MCINVNQDETLYAFLFIKNTDEWEGLTSIPIFLIESFISFTLFYLISYKFMIQTTFKQTFTHPFIFSECYTGDFKIFPHGFDTHS